jgi:hypothetical protein
MTIASQGAGGGRMAGGQPSPTGLADVIDTILDKGLVIDAYIRVSLVGIEVLTIDARIVVASVDTYLRFAEAVNRLDISQDKAGLPELADDIHEGGTKNKTSGTKDKTSGTKTKGVIESVLEATADKLREFAEDQAGQQAVRPGRRQEAT